MKKIILGCSILLILGFSLICLIFYTLTLPKYRNSSKDKPFSAVINKKLITKRLILIIKNPDIPASEKYTYHLEDGNGYGMDSGLEIAAKIPIGTEVMIDKAELHTGRVSGTTSSYLFGTIYSKKNQKEYAFEYSWGDYHTLYEDEPYWTFKLAFWQNKALTEKYFIKVP
ncbi:hypothetical protein MK851_07780 [Tenacibaculum sp. 1B UA]|uniref:hypothetical protein n=1 Tax=Tenacibaculum sp. 1B UA TaxID=2922252 RepID=UPI002A24C407|nr:hypothetical protein [Tenacibaculum sp. 1B UA]MDX8553522.1 hypothetical protein [Tenacibaculum sp. 1B UA]